MKRLLFLATVLLTLTAWGPIATAQTSPRLVRVRRHHSHHRHHHHQGHRAHHV